MGGGGGKITSGGVLKRTLQHQILMWGTLGLDIDKPFANHINKALFGFEGLFCKKYAGSSCMDHHGDRL